MVMKNTKNIYLDVVRKISSSKIIGEKAQCD